MLVGLGAKLLLIHHHIARSLFPIVTPDERQSIPCRQDSIASFVVKGGENEGLEPDRGTERERETRISRVDYHKLPNITTVERPLMRPKTKVAFGVTEDAGVVACRW